MTQPAAADPYALQLAALLPPWLEGQRWFAGKGRDVTVEAVELVGRLTAEPAPSAVYAVRVRHADATGASVAETYQVPLVFRSDEPEQLSHALVAELAGPDGASVRAYDALHDKDVTGAWLRLIADPPAPPAAMHGTRGPALDGTPLPVDEPSLAMTGEQSNTSLAFGDVAIMKVFRRIEPGRNPDIEVHEALGNVGGANIAGLLGWVSATWHGPDGEPVTGDLAMVQEFLRSATDGWALAQISVRDLLAEGDLHAEEVGGDFAAEAHRLGAAVAEIHAALAQVLPTASYDSEALGAVVAGMRGRLTAAATEIPDLQEHVPALAAIFDEFAALPEPLATQRIHGDLHLGQVLRTVNRWVVIDFEGEPIKPLAERVALDSPLRDIAGMLRSFDYAARHHLVLHPGEAQVAYRTQEWADRNIDAFCAGYAAASGRDPREQPTALTAYLADKAVYEVVYEARNRPMWLPVPLGAIARLGDR